MKRLNTLVLSVTAVCGLALTSYATDTIIVNDTWADGNRTSTGPDGSGIDSAWFSSSSSTLTVPAAGDLKGTVGTGSSFWLTYFPSTVTLANPGDEMKVSWTFSMQNVDALNTSQNLTLATALSPTHVTGDGSFPSETYSGYGTFMNVGQTLDHTSPFALKEYVSATAAPLLGTAGAWGANGVASGTLISAGTSGNHGYDSSTTYTYVMDITRDASGNLDIINSISGGTLNGAGSLVDTYTDTTPNSYSYDTFAVRPGSSSATATQFDTTQFEVEFLQNVPEPTVLALVGLGAMGVVCGYRRNRS
jgi:hypothetical protein